MHSVVIIGNYLETPDIIVKSSASQVQSQIDIYSSEERLGLLGRWVSPQLAQSLCVPRLV